MACIWTPVLGMYIYGQSFFVFSDNPCTESFQVCQDVRKFLQYRNQNCRQNVPEIVRKMELMLVAFCTLS